MSLLKVWPHDWCVFLTPITYGNNNSQEKANQQAQLLGTFAQRPEYSQMEELLL